MFKRLFGRKKEAKKNSPITHKVAKPTPPPPKPIQIAEITSNALAAEINTDTPLVIVDLRQPWEYSSGHIPNAINIPLMHLPNRLNELSKEKKLIMQCYHGISSLSVVAYLLEKGWSSEKVFSLSGGIADWATTQGMKSLVQNTDTN